jgi:hypothetical protein
VFNLAIDATDIKPGLPEALVPIRSYFDYPVRKQYRYGYLVFINTCICRNNVDDVRRLTELAHEYNIATDYHVVESPMTEQPHCFSTLNHIVGFCHNGRRAIRWLFKQAMRGFQGVTNWSD